MPVIESLEGRAFVEFVLRVPSNSGTGGAFQFTESLVAHVRSELTDSVVKNTRYVHRFRTSSPEVVDKVLKSAMSDARPVLLFRVGIGNPDKVQYLPWQQHTVVGYSGIVEGIGKQTGHYFELHTQVPIWDFNRINKTTARKGTISQMVAQISEEHGMKETVIEPTIGNGIYYQTYEGDADFIRDKLQHRAANKKGQGNYQFFIRDNALHFHTPEYQSTLKEFHYYNSNATLINLVDNTQKLIDAGVSGCRLVTYDPLTGRTTESLTRPEIATRYEDSIYLMNKLTGAERSINCHVGFNTASEAQAVAQSLYQMARMGSFEIIFQVPKVIGIRAGDILNILINPDADKTSVWSGLYYVGEVMTTVNEGALDATVTARRGETRKSHSDVALKSSTGEAVLTSEHDAPGNSINLKELQGSNLTKGDALSSTSARYTEIKNPNR